MNDPMMIDAFVFKGLNINARYSPGPNVTIVIDGPPLEIQEAIRRYLRQYHPTGYGTTVTDEIEGDNGDLRVTLSRFKSCD